MQTCIVVSLKGTHEQTTKILHFYFNAFPTLLNAAANMQLGQSENQYLIFV